MKADNYVKLAREMLANPPLRSTIWKNMPPEQEGPADEQDVVFDILRRLASEVKPIADARKVKTEQAILSIMLELRQKWFAICDRMKNPAFQKPAFANFCEVIEKKIPHAPVRPQRRPRPMDDSKDAPKEGLPW